MCCLKRSLLLSFWLISFLLGQAQTISIKLLPSITEQNISPKEFIPDPTGDLEIKTVRQGEVEFQSNPRGEMTIAEGPGSYWIRFSLENPQETDRSFILSFEKWIKVNAWVSDSTQQISQHQTGHLIPFVDRDYPVANKACIHLRLPAGAQRDVITRLETHDNYLVKPKDLDFKIASREYFDQQHTNVSTRIGFFTGIFLVMFFYNLFLFISTRDRNYIYYLIILLCVIFLTLHNFGYTVAWFKHFPGYINWHSKMHFIVPGIMSVNLFLFIRGVLAIKERYPLLNKWVTFIIIISISLPIPSLLGYALINDAYSNIAGILALITVLIIAIRSVIDRYPSAWFFLIGYGSFAIGIIIQLLSFENVLPENTIYYNPLQIGSTIEVIMFSFALANRINVLKRDNEEKQVKIIEQLQENEQLQTKVNRELEQKVAERTAEIAKQKDRIQEEMEKSDELLLNILPKATADELKLFGKARPQHYDSVSVLFADVKGFTEIAEVLSPDELVRDLDHCFRHFDEIVERNGLEKIKTIGDAYMCAGGIPDKDGRSPNRVVRAALEMQKFMKEWQEEKLAKGEAPWKLRLGIHTGPVTAGVVGKNKFAYDLWGDTVNLASRMETSGEVDKVNISENTYKLIQHDFTCVPRGKILAKNKGAIDMYFVENMI